MSAPKVAYVSGCFAARNLMREACLEAGFSLVISIFPDGDDLPGFPQAASLLVIESDSYRSQGIQALLAIADAAEVPVLIWAAGPAGLNPSLVDRRHHIHSPREKDQRMFRAILREAFSHPEHFPIHGMGLAGK